MKTFDNVTNKTDVIGGITGHELIDATGDFCGEKKKLANQHQGSNDVFFGEFFKSRRGRNMSFNDRMQDTLFASDENFAKMN